LLTIVKERKTRLSNKSKMSKGGGGGLNSKLIRIGISSRDLNKQNERQPAGSGTEQKKKAAVCYKDLSAKNCSMLPG